MIELAQFEPKSCASLVYYAEYLIFRDFLI